MKIAVCSDLHLEFGAITLENTENAEVLVLSGDICVAADIRIPDMYGIVSSARSDRIFEFFNTCCANFPHVVYVVGNHEHYHYDFKHTLDHLKLHLEHLENLHILDKEYFDLDGVRFIGGTLWTDMNKEDELTLHQISRMMNDFVCVKNSNNTVYRNVPIYKKQADGVNYETDEFGKLVQEGMKKKGEPARFSPSDAVEDHKKMLDYIKHVYDEKMTTVVVGHHAPSKRSTHPRYANEMLMNGGYSSDLEQFIMDLPGIKLWTHGHTHEDFDYMVGDCRVVCNPRGYINHESRADNFKLKVVEV